MKKIIIAAFMVLYIGHTPCIMSEGTMSQSGHTLMEDEINLYCLRQAYPEIKDIMEDSHGDKWLRLHSGAKLPYALKESGKNPLAVDIRDSMAQIYPLEPGRPELPEDFEPGRKRSYALLESLYGDSPKAVQADLVQISWRGRKLGVNKRAAQALRQVFEEIDKLPAASRHSGLLKPDGAYFWRKIAGENVLSAHSYGIAVDLGANKSPYWRWSKIFPHPRQKTYPSEIVSAFERQGFIWGGKWHKYDLMHYEYRPEIICKARLLEARK